jgi:arylsulfatase A-like enzyme
LETLFNELASRPGLLDETLLVFIGDHGKPLMVKWCTSFIARIAGVDMGEHEHYAHGNVI